MHQPTRIRATIKSHSSLLSSGFCCRPSPAGTAWELRAAIRVSRLLPRHDKRTEAADLLPPSVKQAVYELEPEADIVLYGSRARGDAHAESDWDFLILLDGVVDDARTDAIRHRLYDIEWDCGEVLCSIVRSRQEWGSSLHQMTPFAKMLREQGIHM